MKKNTFQSPSLESESIESLSAKLIKTTNELMNTNQELRRVQKEREEMLSNISHDLRAPITAIRSAIDYLNSGNNIQLEDYQSSLALIDRRTKNLETLIQDMYYLFCVEDTSKELNFEQVKAAPFFETYYYDALVDTRYDTHPMELDMAPDLEAAISIDAQRMVRVMDNLLTNAAKYSAPDTPIILRVTIQDRQLCIMVIDEGIGIPQQELSNIFKRTYTVSSSRTPGSATGSGLGLSIVKAIVERHNGTISCKSEQKKGSCFTIQLPLINKTNLENPSVK